MRSCRRSTNTVVLLKLIFLCTFLILFINVIIIKVNGPGYDALFKKSNDDRKDVLLAIGVLSKLSSIARRLAIRETWFNVCKSNPNEVACTFFTDTIEDEEDPKNQFYIDERNHGDLVYMPFKGGYNFAVRLLWMFNYYTRNYNFDFFLRVDDDYFVCLNHLLKELPFRPHQGLYWGYIHCVQDVVRVDEGFMILTRDIIEEVLDKQNTTLMCSAYGDQAMAMWLSESKLNVTYFSDNNRVVHAATGYKIKEYLVQGLCERYIGLHGAYSRYMRQYGDLMRKSNETISSFKVPDIEEFSKVCQFGKNFDWTKFYAEFRFEPKLCKNNPKWTNPVVGFKDFVGREELGHEQIY